MFQVLCSVFHWTAPSTKPTVSMPEFEVRRQRVSSIKKFDVTPNVDPRRKTQNIERILSRRLGQVKPL